MKGPCPIVLTQLQPRPPDSWVVDVPLKVMNIPIDTRLQKASTSKPLPSLKAENPKCTLSEVFKDSP